LTDWGKTALSAQMGYIVPLESMLHLKKVKLMGKMTMLRVYVCICMYLICSKTHHNYTDNM